MVIGRIRRRFIKARTGISVNRVQQGQAMTHEFTCAGCGRTFTSDTTAEEKEREYLDLYGENTKDSDEEILLTCDACYGVIRLWIQAGRP